jgi:hypothetical protein
VLRLLCEKVNCIFPGVTVGREVMARTGVLAVAEVTMELMVPLLGKVRLILKISPEVEGGMMMVKAVGVAEKMNGWIRLLF